ncbi:hypothetical protein [Streptomyces collinus]|uniref:hypothetical protein n=1 Tax=Streptomyces collinus TaxID=42684 RepID=UPI00369A4860
MLQAAKNECGLDEYEVRRYTGWHRHITLAICSPTPFIAGLAADEAAKGPQNDPTSIDILTVAEIRRLLDIFWTAPDPKSLPEITH